jgi:signal transduction histidine kinase
MSLAETITIDKADESVNKSLNIAAVSAKILLNLVEDILDFAKIEAGMFSLNEKRFSIQELIDDIKYIFEAQCERKNIYFKVT